MRKILSRLAILGVVLGGLLAPAITTQPTYADSFLGLTSWHEGVDIEGINGEQALSNAIWKIVTNVASDVTVIAAYLVLGYVIYGGYLYIFANGDPSKVATGKKALTQAFIGLAIVMSANIIMNTIRLALFNNSGNFSNCLSTTTTTNCIDPNTMVTNMIQWVIGVAGAVAVIFIVGGGFMYMTSAGDSGKVQKAKNIILYALIGLVIVALAEAITAFVSTTIRNATTTTSLIETKEYHELQKIA